MKKYRLHSKVICVLLCALLLCSCTPRKGVDQSDPGKPNYLSDPKFDTEDALPQYDSDLTWISAFSKGSCATGDTLYFSGLYNNHEFLQYIDLATGISGPLCGKPECPHNGSECNAFGSAEGLSVYDGKLYWEDFTSQNGPTIFCMNPDGTERATVCSFDVSLSQRGATTRAFHRGYLIRGGQQFAVSGGSTSYGALAYAVDLVTGETAIILDQMREGFSGNLFPIPYRDKVYLFTTFWIPGEDIEETIEIYEWSLKTHELRSLYSQTGNLFFRGAWATEDGILISGYGTGEIFKFDFATNELSLLFDMNADGGNHDIADFAGGYLVNWGLTEERIPHIHVTDLKGNIVYSETLDLPEWSARGFGYSLMGADDGNLYVSLKLHWTEGKKKEFYKDAIVQVPLDGGGTVRELWSNVWEQTID